MSAEQNVSNRTAFSLTDDFLERVCDKGYMDDNLLGGYLNRLSSTRPGLAIELTCRRTLYVPADGEGTGRVCSYVEEIPWQEIEGILAEEGVCYFYQGDILELTLTSQEGIYTSTRQVTGRLRLSGGKETAPEQTEANEIMGKSETAGRSEIRLKGGPESEAVSFYTLLPDTGSDLNQSL